MAKGKATVRTSIDLPAPVHRKLREVAARRGCSARQLILEAVNRIVEADPTPPKAGKILDLDNPPLIPSRGRVIDLTNVYDFIEFP